MTCGGLCPGLNDVIQSIVSELSERYGVRRILGFKYGYLGITKDSIEEPLNLTVENVDGLHRLGGTVLGSSRGPRDTKDIVQTLKKNKINILFIIGGDGTMRGAKEINEEIKNQNLGISIIALPKTIDNDLNYVKMSFGFQTAVEKAMSVISCAHVEASGAPNCIGLVKLMGRHSGYIAAHATLANRDVNYCLIPEVPFKLEGSGGLLNSLEKRLDRKGHAVVVVAEGAGQYLMENNSYLEQRDKSGNLKLRDIGLYLKGTIPEYFKNKGRNINLKYIDPSYIIRGVPANAIDSTYCLELGQNAVHAAMSGKTNMMIGYWNHHFINVPIEMAIKSRNRVDPNGRLWKTVMEATLQPDSIFDV